MLLFQACFMKCFFTLMLKEVYAFDVVIFLFCFPCALWEVMFVSSIYEKDTHCFVLFLIRGNEM